MIIEIKELTQFPSQPQKGDIVYRIDENKIYFYDGTEWISKDYPASLPDKYVVRDRLTRVSYLGKDWSIIVNELRARLKEKFPDYTDWLESDLGMALIDIIAYGLDELAWYQDKIASELFVDTACLRKNVYRLARQLGYTPRSTTAAQVYVDIKLDRTYDFDVIIPKGLRFYAGDLVFELMYDVKILRGELEPRESERLNCIVIEGITKRREFISTGEEWQRFQLDVEINYKLAEGVRVWVDGEEWEEVDNWTYTVGKEFKVFYEDQPYIMFGDGIVAKLPVRGSSILVEYRVCRGALGNISEGKINRADSFVFRGQTINLIVNNPKKGTGGADEETLEEIKINIKKNFLAQDRAITVEDFEKFILNFSHPLGRVVKVKTVVVRGVGEDPWMKELLERVRQLEQIAGFVKQGILVYDELKAYLEGFFSSKRSINLVLFYMLSKDENGNYCSPPPEYLSLDETVNPLLRFLNQKKVVTAQLRFLDGMAFVRNINITVDVKVLFKYDFLEVKAKITKAIKDFLDTLNFGNPLRISDVYGLVENVEGVDYCYVNLECSEPGVVKNDKGDLIPEKGLILMVENLIINEIINA